MIKRLDGEPLISTKLAGILLAALLLPGLGGILWLRGWISTVDEKLATVLSNQERSRNEMYPRSEANLQWQHANQLFEELKGKVATIDARTQTRREDFQRADQPSARAPR